MDRYVNLHSGEMTELKIKLQELLAFSWNIKLNGMPPKVKVGKEDKRCKN